jgi:hypothetical protein
LFRFRAARFTGLRQESGQDGRAGSIEGLGRLYHAFYPRRKYRLNPSLKGDGKIVYQLFRFLPYFGAQRPGRASRPDIHGNPRKGGACGRERLPLGFFRSNIYGPSVLKKNPDASLYPYILPSRLGIYYGLPGLRFGDHGIQY